MWSSYSSFLVIAMKLSGLNEWVVNLLFHAEEGCLKYLEPISQILYNYLTIFIAFIKANYSTNSILGSFFVRVHNVLLTIFHEKILSHIF